MFKKECTATDTRFHKGSSTNPVLTFIIKLRRVLWRKTLAHVIHTKWNIH